MFQTQLLKNRFNLFTAMSMVSLHGAHSSEKKLVKLDSYLNLQSRFALLNLPPNRRTSVKSLLRNEDSLKASILPH